jgi:putative redox protein
MVEIQIRYEGNLSCRAVHVPSGAELRTDAPRDNQGRGESFSPTDLVATALGTCMMTLMGIVARRNEWDLTGTEVRVVKKMVADPLRRIGELEVVIRVPRDFDARARETMEHAALTCPVHVSLPDKVARPVRFEWGVEAARPTGR